MQTVLSMGALGYATRYLCARHAVSEADIAQHPNLLALPGIVARSERTDELWYVYLIQCS